VTAGLFSSARPLLYVPLTRHRRARFAHSWIWLALAGGVAILVLWSIGLAGAVAGALFGWRGTTLVALLFTGWIAWLGALAVLAAPKATLSAGPLKRSGPVGRIAVAVFGIGLFLWGVLDSAAVVADAIRGPVVVNVTVDRVIFNVCLRCPDSRIVTLDGRTYQTVYGWKIWGSVPRSARLLLGSESGRVLWLEPR
jgi:hypothetical protein